MASFSALPQVATDSEAFLTSSSVKREPSTVRRGRRAAPRSRARSPGRARSRRREKRSKTCSRSSRCTPGPFVLDAETRRRRRARRVTVTVAAAVAARVLDEVARARARAPRGRPRRSRAPPRTRSAPASRASSSSRTSSSGGGRRVLARERQQVVGSRASRSASASRSATSAGVAPCRARCATLPRSAVSGVRSSCEASARKRRSDSRARSRLSSIALSVVASRPTSSARCGSGRRCVGSPVRSISPARAVEPRERPQRAAHQQRGGAAPPSAGRDQRGRAASDPCSVEIVSSTIGRSTPRRAPRRRPRPTVRERRRVDAQLVAAERHGPVARRSAGERRRRERLGQHATAERERARDDPPSAVDHLDERLRPAGRRVERARRREQRGRRRRELRDADRPRAERAVELAAQVPRDEHVDARARAPRRRASSPLPRRRSTRSAKAHLPMTKPTPRTVSISGGSPSLRRRFETYRSTTFVVGVALPDLRDRLLARHDAPRVAQQQREQVRLALAQRERRRRRAVRRASPTSSVRSANASTSSGALPRRSSARTRASSSSVANGLTR